MIILKVISVFISLQYAKSANILFISPTASYSHSVVYFPIIRELSLRGHKVLTIIPDMINDSKLVNLTEVDVHKDSYNLMEYHLSIIIKQLTAGYFPVLNQLKWINEYSYQAMEVLFENPDVQQIIHHPERFNFDVVITEWLTFQSSVVFAGLYKCPLIGISSYNLYLSGYDVIGSPTHPIFVPNSWDLYLNPSLFWNRVQNFVNAIEYRYYYKYHFFPKQEYLVKKYFGNNVSSIEEIEKRVSLVLTNTNSILHGSYPKASNLIEFGGIHNPELIPLPEDLKKFLDDAKVGFIYFSLGSNIKSYQLGDKNINTILHVFKQLPYKVLWKFESSDFPGKLDNVFISKWVPQRAVLEHENIKIFITQGGLQSAEEAIRAQVPLLVIPFFADQSQNAGRLEQLGIGKHLLRTELTESNLKDAIYEIINNSSYRNAVTNLAETLWDQPSKPLDRAIWWIEYVIRHKGAKFLRNPALDVPWYQVQLLDVYIFIFCIAILLILVVYASISQMIFYIRTKAYQQNKKLKVN